MDSSTTPEQSATVPDTVRRFAAERDLGDPMDVRHERSTGSMVGIGLALFAVGVIGSLLLSAYNSAQTAASYSGHGGTTTHFFAPTGALALIGLVLAIRGLVIGTRTHYLYSGGLVHKRRSGMQSVTWPEIDALRAVYGKDKGNVVGYRVTGPGGLSILVPLKQDDAGRDPFVDRLLAFAQQHNRPIH